MHVRHSVPGSGGSRLLCCGVFGGVAIEAGKHQSSCQALVGSIGTGLVHATLETTHGRPRLTPLTKGRAARAGLVTKTITADLGFAVSCHGQILPWGQVLSFACHLWTTQVMAFAARRTKLRSLPAGPKSDSPNGAPSRLDRGRLICGNPVRPARQSNRMARFR